MLSYILLGWDTNWTTPWNVLGLQVGNEEVEKTWSPMEQLRLVPFLNALFN